MAYLSVQQDDANRSEAAKVEIEQVVRYGAKVGATPVISALFSEPQPEAEKIAALLALVEAVAISIVRLSKNGSFLSTRLPKPRPFLPPPISDAQFMYRTEPPGSPLWRFQTAQIGFVSTRLHQLVDETASFRLR